MPNKTSGTKEWSDSSVNCAFGCDNDCNYCYAKRMAIRFGRIQNESEWDLPKPNIKAIQKQYRKRNGRVMFPTAHDITFITQDWCFTVLEKLLKSGNQVLITSKPNSIIIKNLCEKFYPYKHQVQFRFTITSISDILLKKYEPNAPNIESRMASLSNAWDRRWKTSVSIEPFLDFDPIPLIKQVAPYCSETIWLGFMSGFVPKEIKLNYSINNLTIIVERIKQLPLEVVKKVRLKDSIQNLLQREGNRVD